MAEANAPLLLAGYRVIELATFVAGPAAAGIMADWGADVIKIEPPGGDPLRWLRAEGEGRYSPTFETLNRGKRCIVADIASPAGRQAVTRLVADADVFVTNIRPAGLVRAGLDWPSLQALNPRLVYASITGYGLSGADADLPAFDNAAFWARSGLADVSRPDGVEPFSIRQGTGDQSCALATALGIVTALLARTRDGGGRLVEASLLRTATYVMTSDLSNQQRHGRVPPTLPRDRALNPINNFFKSAEGRWFFCMPRNTDRDWQSICAIAGLAEASGDPRFATPEARAGNSALLIARLDAAFAQLGFEAIAARFAAADLVWSPVQSLADILVDPQAAAAGCFVEVDDGVGGSFRAPAPPVRFGGQDVAMRGAVAVLGADTAAILAELGLTIDAA